MKRIAILLALFLFPLIASAQGGSDIDTALPLGNNKWLSSRNSVNNESKILKSSSSDNTVINAPSGKTVDVAVAEAVIHSTSATTLLPTTDNSLTFGSAAKRLAGVNSVLFATISGNGAAMTTKSASVLKSALSGATVAATDLIPAKVNFHGCVARVTTLITGATSWQLGDGSDADRWGATLALAAGTTTTQTAFTASPQGWSSSAISPTLTANGSNFTAGAVRITCFYDDFTAPTS